MNKENDLGRVGKPTGLSQAEPASRLGPSGFDPSRFASAEAEIAWLRNQLQIERALAAERRR